MIIIMKLKLLFLFIAYLVNKISGHGMMLTPPGRSSLWRFNQDAKPNYEDNELFCGGAHVQNELNGGKCGVCGDPYTDPHPQANENTGIYGQGIIAGTYAPGSVIEVLIVLTANHLGNFTYSLCQLEDPNAPEPGEDCFQDLLLEDGSANYRVVESDYILYQKVQLPEFKCERCVFRWTYKTGNSWGICEDGESRPGCDPQEHFRSCADIAILEE
ncbi:uncharacterized protein LOC126882922 [Diabrotica virgifera virgifera]|uniref:Chitin-binding type-4 domain-containing protein n=1 Tax=Diabrotica virgifera virgifera TaxID=50390 RepID=A0ABM5K196_DIAVI|nr:uncharacterized protein LOC126882922 [Diabrotica virgifera virgifera]